MAKLTIFNKENIIGKLKILFGLGMFVAYTNFCAWLGLNIFEKFKYAAKIDTIEDLIEEKKFDLAWNEMVGIDEEDAQEFLDNQDRD